MLRRTLIGSLVVTGTLLAPSAAHAVTPTTVVSRVGLPSPLTFSTASSGTCATSSAASLSHIKGPKKPPLGKGSLHLNVHAHSAAAVSESPTSKKLPDLTQMSLSSYLPQASSATDQVMIISLPTNASNDYYQVTLALPATAKTWAASDVFGASTLISWQFIDPSTGVLDSGSSSYGDFSSVHSTVGLKSVGISSINCGGSKQTLDIDALTIGFNDIATTYNFEAAVATRLIHATSAKTIVAGNAVKPRVKLTAGGHPFAGQPVALFQKPAGAKHFAKATTVKTNAKGVATVRRKPKVTTSYQWRFAGSSTFHPASSKIRIVQVSRGLTLRLEKAAVRSGVPLDASGTLTPKHAGTIVRLWERHGKKTRVLIAKGTVHHDGTYSIARNLPVGHYRIFTSVPATKTNAAGKSATRSFVVNGP
jgi:hypothetical protein